MSIYGRTTDNNWHIDEENPKSHKLGELLKDVFRGCEEAQLEEFLEKIKGRSINDLVKENQELLIFPRDLKKTASDDKDGLDSSNIFSIDEKNSLTLAK